MTEDEISEYMSILTRDFKGLFDRESLQKAAKTRVAISAV